MNEIAEIGIAFNTQPLKDGKEALEGLSPAAGRAEGAVKRASAGFEVMDRAANKIVAASNGLILSMDKLAKVMSGQKIQAVQAADAGEKLAKVLNKTATSNDNVKNAFVQTTAAIGAQTNKMTGLSVVALELSAANTKLVNSFNGLNTSISAASVKGYAGQLDDLRAKFNPVFAVIRQYKTNILDIREANKVGALSVQEMNEALTEQRQAALTAIAGLKGVKPAILETVPDLNAMRAKFDPVFAVIQQYKTNVMEIKQANEAGALGTERMNEALIRQRTAALTAIRGLKGIKPAIEEATPDPNAMRMRYDPMFATLTQYKTMLNQIRADEAAGVLSQERSVIAQGMLRRSTMRTIDAFRMMDPALRKTGKAATLTGTEMLNFSRQMADIGVTAAMGMNPLMILVQQGPQIADVFQTAAMRGMTFKQTLDALTASFRRLMTTAAVALIPFLPLIAGVAAVVGTVVAGIALATRAINSSAGDLSKSMGLTKEQIERVEKAGVSMSVTFGDTMGAVFEVLGSRIYDAFETPLSWLEKQWEELMDKTTMKGKSAFDFLVGAAYVLVYDIKTIFWTLPQAIGEVFVDFVNTGIREINRLLPAMAQLKEIMNPFEGKSKELMNFGAGSLAEQAAGEAAGARFRGEVGDVATKNRRNKISEAAGKPAKTPKSRGRSDADKFADIVNGAQRDIASVEAEIKGVNLTADAALRLKNEQKLLNEAQQKGITLTVAQRAKLMELAGTLTDAQVKLKNLEGIRDIFKGVDDQSNTLDEEFEMLGRNGVELFKIQQQYDMINQAKAKGLTITKELLSDIEREAGNLAEKQNRNRSAESYIANRDSMLEEIDLLNAQSLGVGKTAVEMQKLMFARQLENDQKYRGIVYSQQEIKELTDLNAKHAELTESIRKQQEQYEFNKSTVKGFFSEFRSGLNDGKSIWASFSNAAVNAINKIVDRLIDMQLEILLTNQKMSNSGGGFLGTLMKVGTTVATSMGGGSSGGGFSNTPSTWGDISYAAKGKAFDGAKFFAKGDVFNTPQAFMFGKGGSNLGIMGEAGPEAIMPLKRGSDGSLGVQMYGGGSGSSNSRSSSGTDVRVTVMTEEGPMFRTVVRDVAQSEAVSVAQSAFTQYDAQMPERFKQIVNDDRVRG